MKSWIDKSKLAPCHCGYVSLKQQDHISTNSLRTNWLAYNDER